MYRLVGDSVVVVVVPGLYAYRRTVQFSYESLGDVYMLSRVVTIRRNLWVLRKVNI